MNIKNKDGDNLTCGEIQEGKKILYIEYNGIDWRVTNRFSWIKFKIKLFIINLMLKLNVFKRTANEH